MLCTEFLLYVFEPVDGYVYHVREVVVNLVNLLLSTLDVVVGLVFVELEDALHLYLHQAQNVIAGDSAEEVLYERFETLADVCDG